MISVKKAIEIVYESVPLLREKENVSLFECSGRILYEDIIAGFNVPLKNNSAMDGYAVISSDTAGATDKKPVALQIKDEIRAGGKADGKILDHQSAIRIMTGAPVPDGADAVVPFEESTENGNSVLIKRPFGRFENIRFAGEDIRAGEIILKRGTRIDSAETGLLASLDIYEVPVFRKPEVAILSTGDELVEPGKPNPEGKIFNSNAYVLYSEVKKYGANPHYEGIVVDDRAATRKKMEELLKYDVIITSGGVSMGKYDFIPEVLNELGIDIRIRKVLMKPGKPVVFGVKGEKLFFGLPGNPVSVMVSFLKFVRPALLKMSGSEKDQKPLIKAILTEDITKREGRRHFIRGKFTIRDGRFFVETTGAQGSGILTSMSKGNCLIVLPEETVHVCAGETVDIELINHGEI